MKHFVAAITLAWIIITSVSCYDNTTPTPRRTAYPRINLTDSVMRPAENVPMYFLVNDAAKIDSPRKGWINVHYENYKTTIYITFTTTTPDSIEHIITNRMERLLLNTGDRAYRQSEFINQSGLRIFLAETDGSTTPLQFIATDDSSVVVSGVTFISDANAANIDSINPIIDALRCDILRSLGSLAPLK